MLDKCVKYYESYSASSSDFLFVRLIVRWFDDKEKSSNARRAKQDVLSVLLLKKMNTG